MPQLPELLLLKAGASEAVADLEESLTSMRSDEADTLPSRWALAEEAGASEDEGEEADKLNSSVVTESNMAMAAAQEGSADAKAAELW